MRTTRRLAGLALGLALVATALAAPADAARSRGRSLWQDQGPPAVDAARPAAWPSRLWSWLGALFQADNGYVVP